MAIMFAGWNILDQKNYSKSTEEFSIKESNPQLGRILLEFPRIYLFRPNFEPYWENGQYRGRLNVLQKVDICELEIILKAFVNHPVSKNENVAGIYYGYNRKILRFWITGSESDAIHARNELKDALKTPLRFEAFMDIEWKAQNKDKPEKQLEIYRKHTSINADSDFKFIITCNEKTLPRNIAKCINEVFVQYNFATDPLINVVLDMHEKFQLTIHGHSDRRGDILKQYSFEEFLVILAAEWKRKIHQILMLKLPESKQNIPLLVSVYKVLPKSQQIFVL